MTVRSDIGAIVGRVAHGAYPGRAAGLVLDYFFHLGATAKPGQTASIRVRLTHEIGRIGDGLTADQTARLVIRHLHDVGVVDVRDGWLDDDPEMLLDLAETADIPA